MANSENDSSSPKPEAQTPSNHKHYRLGPLTPAELEELRESRKRTHQAAMEIFANDPSFQPLRDAAIARAKERAEDEARKSCGLVAQTLAEIEKLRREKAGLREPAPESIKQPFDLSKPEVA